jgi:hypothetical protein
MHAVVLQPWLAGSTGDLNAPGLHSRKCIAVVEAS